MISASQVHRFYTSKTQAICYSYNLNAMVFRKLQNLVARQAQATVSTETANNQPSSDDQQPEPILVCSFCSLPTVAEVPVTVVTNKGHKRKRQISESEADEVLISTSNKSDIRRKQNCEIQDSPDPFELMMNYFDKRFEGIEKKLQQPSNKNAKIEDTFKLKHKGNRIQLEFNQKVFKIVENLSSALNNDDTSEANGLCDDLTEKPKRRNKLIKMADRSILG